MRELVINKNDPVRVIDQRVELPDSTIPANLAEPGKLYLTDGGSLVMSAMVPAEGYEKLYPGINRRIFIYPDGRAFPATSKRLTPINGTITWTIEGIQS